MHHYYHQYLESFLKYCIIDWLNVSILSVFWQLHASDAKSQRELFDALPKRIIPSNYDDFKKFYQEQKKELIKFGGYTNMKRSVFLTAVETSNYFLVW